MIVQRRATLDDLYKVEGKAELIGGRIVQYMASGHRPSRVALRIAMKLEAYAQQVSRGHAYADGIGFAVPELASGRESFSPMLPITTGRSQLTRCGSSKAHRPSPSK
jgi:hypothetical protein